MTLDYLIFEPSPIHGTGAFASRAIRAGTRVIEYLGEIIDKQESLRRCAQNNHNIFAISSTQDIDGSVQWNPARFINHRCEPNCEAVCEDQRIWIVAVREIAPGEELTFNYSHDLEDYRDYACHCGARCCVGYIVAEEFFEHVRKQTEARAESAIRDS